MPESPDFESIARQLVEHCTLIEGTVAQEISLTAEQLRLVWNARGAADIAKLEAELSWMQGTLTAAGPSVKHALRVLRSLDR